MRFTKWAGLLASLILLFSCFSPWTYYPDINKTFTGFFSENNAYGKPGKFLLFFALASIILILVPKVWAKRTHLFLSALFLGYAIKSYILFISCYNTICPEKRYGIYLMILSCCIILVVAVLPDLKLTNQKKNNN